MKECWDEEPDARPSFANICTRIRNIIHYDEPLPNIMNLIRNQSNGTVRLVKYEEKNVD